jgi:hypothetical protein
MMFATKQSGPNRPNTRAPYDMTPSGCLATSGFHQQEPWHQRPSPTRTPMLHPP